MHSGTGSAKLTLTVEGTPPAVRADRDQIARVLTNLVQNALDAVKERGSGGAGGGSDADPPQFPEEGRKEKGDGDVRVTVGALGPSQAFVT